MRKQMYRGQSIREDNGSQAGLPCVGKYAAVVSQQDVTTFPGEGEAAGEWGWIGINSCTGGFYDTEQEALDSGIAFARSSGFVESEQEARANAVAALVKRHNDHCGRSASYRKHYGPETTIEELV